jgi:hypothetical protein
MTLGLAPRQGDLLRSTANFCEGRVSPNSIYAVLHRECFRLFPDELFADLFTDIGRRSVPPMIVAVVMVLQRSEGLSDREATERFAFDARWKYAAGGLDFDYPAFVHTVLVDMRARLARSDRPNRIFEVTLEAARKAGLVGRKRVLDSTPLYDAVATMDTITLIRSAIRGLLQAADAGLEAELRTVLSCGDDYASTAKPQIDWEDATEREALIDSRAQDAFALLTLLEGRDLGEDLAKAAHLLATVVGQDLAGDTDGVFRVARKVAKDRVISTVDPQARHGHKTSHRGFDGYKGHVAIDPDSELITATAASAGNGGDAEVAERLLADVLPTEEPADDNGDRDAAADLVEVYGDSAYGTGELLKRLEDADAHIGIKVQPAVAPGGRFTKDRFTIDLHAGTVTCPAGITVPFRDTGHQRHAAVAEFGAACRTCPLAAQCTTATSGRSITISAYETQLAAARARRHDPAWRAAYRATRPKVERKIGHLMRRRHGGRRARVRGLGKVAADFALLAAAINLARLAGLGLTGRAEGGWQVTPA